MVSEPRCSLPILVRMKYGDIKHFGAGGQAGRGRVFALEIATCDSVEIL